MDIEDELLPPEGTTDDSNIEKADDTEPELIKTGCQYDAEWRVIELRTWSLR